MAARPHQLIPVDANGVLDLAVLEAALARGAALVSVMAANNETGVLQPLPEIAALCRRFAVAQHCDAAQALRHGALPELARQGASLTLSGHKIGAPRGIGALITRAPRLRALLHGGAQEAARRAGTENVAGAVALAAALELPSPDSASIRTSRDTLEAALCKEYPELLVHGRDTPRLPGHLSFSHPSCVGEALVTWLDDEGIEVSSGSACATAQSEPSHVLRAMGVSRSLAQGALRISLGAALDQREQRRVLAAIGRGIAHLERIQGMGVALPEEKPARSTG